MGDRVGERVEVEVTSVAHGGIAVARLDGRVVFVSDAIPGETVLAEVTDDTKPSFWRADAVEVLERSPHRKEHVWAAASIDLPPAERAGGAEFGHIELGHQRELKRQVIADALERMAGIETGVVVEAVPSGASAEPASEPRPDTDGTSWRTRVRLHVSDDGTVGPYAARSHHVIPVADLPLAVPEAASAAPLARRFPRAEFVDVVAPSTGDPQVLVLDRDRRRRRRPPAIVERVADRDFRLDAGGFWQVHRHAASVLTQAVQSAIDETVFDPSASNLDLYGGVGLLAAAMGRLGPEVRMTTVESDTSATGHARANLADWPSATAVTARVDRFLNRLDATADARERAAVSRGTVVLDPPRSGAGKAVIESLAALQPVQVVYVACDPVALARDVALFSDRGYYLSGIRALDLFPNTHHVEVVVTLRIGGAGSRG